MKDDSTSLSAHNYHSQIRTTYKILHQDCEIIALCWHYSTLFFEEYVIEVLLMPIFDGAAQRSPAELEALNQSLQELLDGIQVQTYQSGVELQMCVRAHNIFAYIECHLVNQEGPESFP